MSGINVVVCAECSSTMEGLPMQELNRGLGVFVERIRMHPATSEKLNLIVMQFRDKAVEVLHEGRFGHASDPQPAIGEFAACKETAGPPDLAQAVHRAAEMVALADKVEDAKKARPPEDGDDASDVKVPEEASPPAVNNYFVVIAHNAPLETFDAVKALEKGEWLFVAVDDPAIFAGCEGALAGNATVIVLRGVMFIELFHWLADQFLRGIEPSDGTPPAADQVAPSFKNVETLRDAIRGKIGGLVAT